MLLDFRFDPYGESLVLFILITSPFVSKTGYSSLLISLDFHGLLISLKGIESSKSLKSGDYGIGDYGIGDYGIVYDY